MTSQPYIVTHREEIGPHEGDGWDRVLYREAFATLEEARSAAYRVMVDSDPDDTLHPERLYEAKELPASGGTLGPLPDGSVIEVKATTRARLLEDIVRIGDPRAPAADISGTEALCRVWNERFGNAAQDGAR